jgi:predicted ATPase/class 3 adenylate cyclase
VTELPSGTVTFLFTDLEGSTLLWQEHPEAMRDALARHDQLVRGAIEDHDGYVVKTTGDGFHAAFTESRHALDAAVAAELALGAEPWPLPEPLRVRIGIHTGPAEARDGDYYGTTVNKAARLMSVAHGGQILVSHATEALLREHDTELRDLGEHRLRDLARPEHVHQVLHPELPIEFPPLTTLDALPGNLPVQPTSFVGRDEEVARVAGMLDGTCLVSLVGTGGVGKTRLALQVAAEALPRFADGAWYCELAAVDDGHAMAQVVATSLGCKQRPGLTLAQSVVEYVRVRELLLVLDNCEHLLDAAGDLADSIVRSCPRVSVLTTTREPLDVEGERIVRVRPLDAPGDAAAAADIAASAAGSLFADRASDTGSDTGWTDVQWAAVGEICRRVDGIPLAIELAAARTASMLPTDIAAHLDERFRLLTGKRRGRVERQQTLRATVEWSYQLLDEDERAVFDRFGVFAGGFDAAGAVAVAAGDNLDEWTVTDALASLVDKSMLGTEAGPDESTRYTMLETLRQYARDRLDERGEADQWRGRHARHYAAWAHEAGFGYVGPEQQVWDARIRAQLDNLRAAVLWALEREDPEEIALSARIIAALESASRENPETGFEALALEAVPVVARCAPELRGAVVASAAWHEWDRGRLDEATALALDAARVSIGAVAPYPFEAHTALLWIAMSKGDYGRARAIAEEARAALDPAIGGFAEAMLLGSLGCAEGIAGDFARALEDAEHSIAVAQQVGNPTALGMGYHALAWALQRDDPRAALEAAERSLGYAEAASTLGSNKSGVLALAGGLRARTGDNEGALALMPEAVRIARDTGIRPTLAATLDWALAPLVRTGRAECAATFVGALDDGALASVAQFPGMQRRSRIVVRIRDVLGDDATDAAVARGAAMSYDELVAYALEQLSGD